jgi:hypothetical protein
MCQVDVTLGSLGSMGLKVGDRVDVLAKALEVLLTKP